MIRFLNGFAAKKYSKDSLSRTDVYILAHFFLTFSVSLW